jgi:hypothetical protein
MSGWHWKVGKMFLLLLKAGQDGPTYMDAQKKIKPAGLTLQNKIPFLLGM